MYNVDQLAQSVIFKNLLESNQTLLSKYNIQKLSGLESICFKGSNRAMQSSH
jgi:hypothetical protein